ALSFSALVSSAALAADAIPDYVQKSVDDVGRPWWEQPLDPALKPAETMAFAQIKPGQAVAEILPDYGYWTRILAKIVGHKGRVYTMVPGGKGPVTAYRGQNEMLTRIEHAYAIPDIAEYNNAHVIWGSLAEFGLPEQIDAVFTADYHTLHSKEFEKNNVADIDKGVFRAMKNGAVFTVMDHAANPGAGFAVAETLHRSDPDAVKAEVTAAGFVFDGESKVAAKAGDNHTSVANDETLEDIEDYFIFRFKKPV